jgi:hypothetical protein
MADLEIVLNKHHPQYEEHRKLFVRGNKYTVDSPIFRNYPFFDSGETKRSVICVYKRKQRYGDTKVKFDYLPVWVLSRPIRCQ